MLPEVSFPSQFKKDISKLQQAYIEKLKVHLDELRGLREFLEREAPPRKEIQQIYNIARRLADSGLTFGFPEISDSFRALYLEVQKFLAQEVPVSAVTDIRREALARFAECEQACEFALEYRLAPTARPMAVPEISMPLKIDQGADDVYVISQPVDRGVAEAMAAEISQFGYMVYAGGDEGSFRDTFAKGHMKAVLIFTDLSEKELAAIRELRALNARVPVIVITPYDDFEARLRAARAGAQGYVPGKSEIIRVVEKIERLADQYMAVPDYHVLIVDDDEMLTEFYRHALARSGLKVSVINNPKETAPFLSNNDVDLILIDNWMPGCSGQELAAIVRQYDEFLSVPIVFLSPRDEIEALQGNGPGIDEYLVKPFAPDQLLGVVRSRAMRSQELKSVTAHDTFTGLFNQEYFTDMLETEMMRTKRTGALAAYAEIDIDGFKQINSQFGHHVGDQVIKMFSHMLRHHLRRTDIIGRMNGETFGIILPGCDLKNAKDALEKFRKKVTESFFTVRQQKVRVTFSAGLVLVDGKQNADDLIKAADFALFTAKERGRNQIATP